MILHCKSYVLYAQKTTIPSVGSIKMLAHKCEGGYYE